jgi:hypothetical protein
MFAQRPVGLWTKKAHAAGTSAEVPQVVERDVEKEPVTTRPQRVEKLWTDGGGYRRAPVSARMRTSPAVTEDAVELSVPDGRFRSVALVHELRRPRVVPFERHGGRWELRLPRPPVDRLEYLLELERRDGSRERGPDPRNPLRAPGPFGEKSVVEFPGYASPAWLDDDESQTGELRELPFGILWSAAESEPDQPLPLVLVHDGPEYAAYSSLLRLFDHLVAFGELPPFRAALLPPPGDRNESYSASTRYARLLADRWLPALA